MSEREMQIQELAREIYRERLDSGVAREQARKDLLLSTYTEAYWKIDLHNLLHFLRLRMDVKAQLEIRKYAETIAREVVRRWCPITYEAFEDYLLGGVSLSSREQEMIASLVEGDADRSMEVALERCFVADGKRGRRVTLEGMELEDKLNGMGLGETWKRYILDALSSYPRGGQNEKR